MTIMKNDNAAELAVALVLSAKNTFQFAASLLAPRPSSLSEPWTPYHDSATLPGILPVVSQGNRDVEGVDRLLTRTGVAQVLP